MSGLVSAYGFLGKWPGSVRERTYRMPSSVHASFRDWKLFSVALWPAEEGLRASDFSDPDPFRGLRSEVRSCGPRSEVCSPDLLLSVKVEREYGRWEELLLEPRPLRDFVPQGVDLDLALSGAVPERLRSEPGDFYTFVGEVPCGWARLSNSPRGSLETLASAPLGPVAVRWQGKLRGLLLMGMRY